MELDPSVVEQFLDILSGLPAQDEHMACLLESFLLAHPDFDPSQLEAMDEEDGIERLPSVLHWTCRRGYRQTSKVLIEHNRKWNRGWGHYAEPDRHKYSDPYRLAILGNHIELVQDLLDKEGIPFQYGFMVPNIHDSKYYAAFGRLISAGRNPLMEANTVEMVQLLRSHGAVADDRVLLEALRDDQEGFPCNIDLVTMLLETWEDKFDKKSRNPIEHVILYSGANRDLLALLMDKGFTTDEALSDCIAYNKYDRPTDEPLLAAIDFLVVERGVDPTLNNPLYWACRRKKLKVAKRLVQLGVPVETGFSGFLETSPSEQELLVWLEKLPGADVLNVDNEYGQNALHLVLFARSHLTRCSMSHVDIVPISHVDCVPKLIELGVPVGAKDKKGYTPLIAACKSARYKGPIKATEAIQRLLKHPSVGVCEQDSTGKAAIHFAPRAEIVDILVQAGADLNIQDREGNTPLHVRTLEDDPVLWRDAEGERCSHGALVVARLLEHGANPHLVNKAGMTPLLLTLHSEKSNWYYATIRMTRALLSHGANVNAVDSKGNSALHHLTLRLQDQESMGGPHRRLTELLLEHKANIHQENHEGETPLLNAWLKICGSNLSYVEFFLSQGANPKKVDNKGNSLLHILCRDSRHKRFDRRKHMERFRLLMDNGCDPVAPNLENETPIMIYTAPEGTVSISLDVLYCLVSNTALRHGSASVVPYGIRGERPSAETSSVVSYSCSFSSLDESDHKNIGSIFDLHSDY
uniref:Uncharacterized protein n=1 Tax=Entomoneis paludosa TaxID=265537 RepID=A0A7S3DNI3_9STRA|mmetsp:Transcript_23226/g.48298  ORF Transcript_23226/g.48298 Transcript_23226/m.48298 type:complete len:751 (+) Transcript_23226:186-2438(+)|eukprot:CAMPEP_0172465366 /NCGR_PEP_ID=MMETSP1065-20121228/53277_1 /TAXON_ID=265537 /ORGANISM="Amphiprora paludosa, Strain CCMP125" /LENGTH=750 /DNA_ID=CAMNT_0013221873 /DNA_START=125 /DNA_END=2377 /DNA_ORIENTATION=-